MARRPRPFVVAGLALAWLAASCAGGDDGGADKSVSSSDPSAASTSTIAEEAAGFLDVNADVRAEMERVAGTDEDGPFFMVNLLDFHDIAEYPAGSEWEGSTGLEANQRYNEVSQPAIEEVGGALVFAGSVERSLIDGPIGWDLVGIVRYPSRQAVIDLGRDPEFAAASEHKDASLAHTFAMVSDRIDLPSVPDPDPAALPHPPTAEDPGFMMVHVIDFLDEADYEDGEEPADAPISGREAVDRYTQNAGLVAAPLGVRARAWFEVDAALLGAHQDWEQVRLNEFPSRATFEALTSDPTWAEGRFHRTAGIDETYALITRPLLFDRTFAEPAA